MAENELGSLLHHLADQLSPLCDQLQDWLGRKHYWPYDTQQLQMLRQRVDNLRHEVSRLRSTEVYVIIVFMGGTGVGKSTLLNALAGERIAEASIQRPTTRHAISYVHADIPSASLPPAILDNVVRHQNAMLKSKILVDAPDIDSRETENYHRLRSILPHTDIILYVGSPEKYHDRVGWELFREFSQYKAFAFVLNRWDECVAREQVGQPPDKDWLEDLRQEGYVNPRFFRTSALHWVEKRYQEIPEEDQLPELRRWLDVELTEKTLLAIRQTNLEASLSQVADWAVTLTEPASISKKDVWPGWLEVLDDEIEQFCKRCEHFLRDHQEQLDTLVREESKRQIPGWLAGTLNSLRGWSFLSVKLKTAPSETLPASYTNTYIADLVHNWSQRLENLYLSHYGHNLTNRLLVVANSRGVPPAVLEDVLQETAKTDWLRFWKDQMAQALEESLQALWQPTSWRGRFRSLVHKWLPGKLCWLAGFAGLSVLIYRMFFAAQHYSPGLWDVLYFLLPFAVAEIVSYLLVYSLSPRDSRAILSTANDRLRKHGRANFSATYERILTKALDRVHAEIGELKHLIEKAKQIIKLIEQRREEIEEVKRLYRS